MTLPITTTTLTISRQDDGLDSDETASYTTVAIAVPAVVSSPSGADRHLGGQQTSLAAVAYMDLDVDIQAADMVVDNTSGQTYYATWTVDRYEFGLDHKKVGLRWAQGAAYG